MLVLNALQWAYDANLDSPPARWSCEYVESGSTAHLPGESVAEAGEEHVQIDVTLDGHTGRLTTGTVREFGFREEPDRLVSIAQGLDFKADLLDYHISTAVTYRGMQVLSGSTAPVPAGALKVAVIGSNSAGEDIKTAFFESFKTAARKVVEAAGFTASFDCYDYDLGQDVVWETDRSANDILVQLAAPYNATERFKLDIFVEPNNKVRFVERGRTVPPQTEVELVMLTDREVVRSKFPPFNDVQVAGANYNYVDPDMSPPGFWVEGTPSDESKIVKWRIVEHEVLDLNTAANADAQTVLTAEILGTDYFDKEGINYRQTQTKNYFNFMLRNPKNGTWAGTFPYVKREDTDRVEEYDEFGRTTKVSQSTFLEDFTIYYIWDSTAGGGTPPVGAFVGAKPSNLVGYVQRHEEELFYDADGVLYYQTSKDYSLEIPDPVPASSSDPTPTLPGLILTSETQMRFFWSQKIYWRALTKIQYKRDGTPGVVAARSSSIEPLPEEEQSKFRPRKRFGFNVTPEGWIGTWETGAEGRAAYLTPFRLGHRQGSAQVKAGPDNAQLRFTFGVLGTPTDCEYFRGKIKTERKSTRYEAKFGLLPNLEYVEGRNLTVLNAPGRWKHKTFYLFSRSVRHEPRRMSMDLRGLAWSDP